VEILSPDRVQLDLRDLLSRWEAASLKLYEIMGEVLAPEAVGRAMDCRFAPGI
jgi:hypothetical protein